MARKSPSLLKPREAADALGISYPTIKQWILRGKLKTVKTPGGHHRIPEAQLRPHLKRANVEPNSKPTLLPVISGRNQLLGTVREVTIDGLLAKVVLTIGDQQITSIITADAARELKLKPGTKAFALIKATEVMIGRSS
jgi:molybdopterin-binding protein